MSGWVVGMIVLFSAELGLQIAKHGKDHGPYSVWVWLPGAVIYLGLLYGGGFFN